MCVCVCVLSPAGDPGAGEPRGDVHHPGRGRLAAVHPGSVAVTILAHVAHVADYTQSIAALRVVASFQYKKEDIYGFK